MVMKTERKQAARATKKSKYFHSAQLFASVEAKFMAVSSISLRIFPHSDFLEFHASTDVLSKYFNFS